MKDRFHLCSMSVILLIMSLFPIAAATQSKPQTENKKPIEGEDATPGAAYEKQAHEALHQKRFDEAVRLFEKAADAGNGNAMGFLGDTYYYGKVQTQDFQKARFWYEKAAAIGYLTASERMNHLGVMYANGQGVKRDDHKALQWFQKSADGDNTSGMYNLANMYEQGRGMPQDLQQARSWYEKAAKKGNEDAKKRLQELSK